jgi:hypothetical protein
MQSHRPGPVNTFHPQQDDLRIRDVDQITLAIHLLLAIDKCISLYTYSVLIEDHLVLSNSLKQKPFL